MLLSFDNSGRMLLLLTFSAPRFVVLYCNGCCNIFKIEGFIIQSRSAECTVFQGMNNKTYTTIFHLVQLFCKLVSDDEFLSVET